MFAFYFLVHTANVLGAFNDPFEFEGDYGSEVNPVREKVFELIVPKEAIARHADAFAVMEYLQKDNLSEQEVEKGRFKLLAHAINEDQNHGPLLQELVTDELVNALSEKQKLFVDSGFKAEDLEKIQKFFTSYGDRKVFRFFKSGPQNLLRLETVLWDLSTKGEGKNLPIVSSKHLLKGNSSELKRELLDTLFTEEMLNLTRGNCSLPSIDESFVKETLGVEASAKDLEVFFTPAGQIVFYWMYQSLNLHLLAEEPALIEKVNKVKEIFAQTLGNSEKRAETFREKLLTAGTSVLFTQESDKYVVKALTQDGLFHSVDKQNPDDGTFVFLKSEIWEPEYEVLEVKGYENAKRGKLNIVLATLKGSGKKFLLASAHGHSTKPEDGRQQVSLIAAVFRQMQEEDKDLQLIIGIDANTKSHQDVEDMKKHLDSLGLIATSVGPTTVKKRMVTTQHPKAARAAIDEEDYLITLKPKEGAPYPFTEVTVGFSESLPDVKRSLPNIDNPSDHYPVGAKFGFETMN